MYGNGKIVTLFYSLIGITYNWADSLEALVEESVTDEQLSNTSYEFPINPMVTKEEYYYPTIFKSRLHLDQEVVTIASITHSSPFAIKWEAHIRIKK